MAEDLRTPDRRTCERCGRREEWDDDRAVWRVASEDGQRRVGDPYCVHEWDIDGTFEPVER